jgi:hypothetical protein
MWSKGRINAALSILLSKVEDKWSNLQQIMADRWEDLAYAIGGWSERKDRRTGKFVDGPCERWEPGRKVLKAVIQYVEDTKRFRPKATMEEAEAEEAGQAEGVGVAERAEVVEKAAIMEGVGATDEVGGSL